MKKILVLICVLVIAVAVVLFLPGKVEDAVVAELQQQGKRIFGTEVMVSDIDIDIKNGTASIREISIANPEIYSEPMALMLSSIMIKFNYKSGVIEEIIVSEPHVFAELVDKNLNILDLANHAESARRNAIPAAAENKSSAQPDTTQAQQEPEKAPPIFTINLAVLENPSVSLKSNLTEQQKQFTIQRLEARDLQGNPQQLADQLVKRLFNDLSRQVIAESVMSVGEDALEDLKDKAREKLKNLLN